MQSRTVPEIRQAQGPQPETSKEGSLQVASGRL